MRKYALYINVLIIHFLLSSCSNNQFSGNASETGNPIIMGEALISFGQPVDSITLIVRKHKSIKSDTDYSYLGEEFNQDGELKISTEQFNFNLQDTGTYTVELRSGDTLAAMQYVTVLSDRTYNLQKMELDTLQTISGSVSLHGAENSDVTIYAKGLDRATEIQADGTFALSVPKGIVPIKIVPSSDNYRPVDIPNVLSGTSIDEVKILAIQPVSNSYECDSLIIRTILDSNQLYAVEVDQVTVTSSNRIVEFDVAADTNQPDMINISGQIVTIPSEIGGLTALEELEIQYTSLTSLPEAIGLLVGLEELELNHNNLTSLPESIINLTPFEELSLSGNSLKLNEQQTIWANKYDPDWAEKQQ